MTFPSEPTWGWYAIRIERGVEISQWPDALASVPEAHRAEVEAYLRSIAGRVRLVRRMRRDQGQKK